MPKFAKAGHTLHRFWDYFFRQLSLGMLLTNPTQHNKPWRHTMKSKAPRLVIALVALVSLAGMTVPADAAAPAKQARSGWCC